MGSSIAIQIRVSHSFDETTPLTADDLLLTPSPTQGKNYWILTQADGTSFPNLGILPMQLLSKVLTFNCATELLQKFVW